MKNGIKAVGFIGCFLSFGVVCGQQPNAETIPVKKEHQLTMAWGDYYIPLQLWAAPYYFKAEAEITLDKALELMSQPIRFFQNGKPYYLSGLQAKAQFHKELTPLVFVDTTGLFPRFVAQPDSTHKGYYKRLPEDPLKNNLVLDSFISHKSHLFEWESQLALESKLRMGDHITFSTPPRKSEGIVLTGVTIRIYNPYAEFRPRYYVPPVSYVNDEQASWQVVESERFPLKMLRFNPEDTTNVKVRTIYASNQRYELIPIPGFITISRFVNDQDYIVPPGDVEQVDTLTKEMIDPFRVNDILVEWREGWEIQWGDIQVLPQGPFVKREDFLKSLEKPMYMVKAKNPLTILQARMSIVPLGGQVRQYIINPQQPEVWKAILRDLDEDATIYFEDLIIKNDSGQPGRMWVPYSLNIFGPRD